MTVSAASSTPSTTVTRCAHSWRMSARRSARRWVKEATARAWPVPPAQMPPRAPCLWPTLPFCHTGCSPDRLKLLHFLRQSSRQSEFTWHQDHDENRDAWAFTTSMITVVISLSGSGSGMQVWGFPVYVYSGAGAGAAFPGAATHRSVSRVAGHTIVEGQDEEVVKVAFFLE
jgi:hypothetical protein